MRPDLLYCNEAILLIRATSDSIYSQRLSPAITIVMRAYSQAPINHECSLFRLIQQWYVNMESVGFVPQVNLLYLDDRLY